MIKLAAPHFAVTAFVSFEAACVSGTVDSMGAKPLADVNIER